MATLQETVRKDIPRTRANDKAVRETAGKIISGKIELPEDTLKVIKYAYQLGVKDGKATLLKSQNITDQKEIKQMSTVTKADMENLQKRVAQLKESVDQEARTFTPIRKQNESELLTTMFDFEKRSEDERNLASDVLLAKLDNNYQKFAELVKSYKG